MKQLLIAALLIMGMPAQAQDKPKTEEHPFITDGNVVTTSGGIIQLSAPDPCDWVGMFDGRKKICAIHIAFSNPGRTLPVITCSPVSSDPDGVQHMVCWYTPKEKPTAPSK